MKRTSTDSPYAIGVLEMGRLGTLVVRVVAANLQALLGVPVDILGSLDVPQEAFRHHRHQYDAGIILQLLAGLNYPKHPRIIALTNVDLCISILTYVFGEAELGGKVAIASNYRLRHHEDGTNVSAAQHYERLAKVALHELGHTLSAYHCDNPKCLMKYSPKVHHLDQLDLLFCKDCEFIIKRNLRVLGLSDSFYQI